LLLLINKIRKANRFRKSTILKKIKSFLKWNIIARTFLENAIPLMLGVFLQFRVMIFKKAYVILCCLFAIFSFVYFIIFTYFITKALYTRNQAQLDKEPVRKVFGTLYEGISLKDPESKYYNLLILARGVMLVTLVSFCQTIPILQITILIPFNAGLVYYLFKTTIFEDRYLNIVNKIKEILILLGEVGILCLNFKSSSEAYYDTLGWLITICFASALLIELGYMIVMQIYNLRTIKKKAMDFWSMVTRWFNNIKARRRHRRQRVRRIQPHNVKLELSAMPTVDISTELPHVVRLGHPLKVNMLNSFNTIKTDDPSMHTLNL